MTDKDFENILNQGEGYNIEFKRSLNKEISKEACSFLNSSGGKLVIGVNDNNTLCGIKLTNGVRSQIYSYLQPINPTPDIKVIEYSYKEKDFIILDCKSGKEKPYITGGMLYVRIGANAQKLTTPNEMRDFFQQVNKIFFEKKECDNFLYPDDFDDKRFNLFLKNAAISQQLPQKNILENLELFTEKDKLNNAGVLFFAKNTQKHHKHASTRCLLFKGIDKHLIFDDKLIEGNLQEQYKGALEFLKSKLELRYIIKTAGPRVEKYEIPENVFKEAIINALVHRDYYETGGKIHIEIYDNRVEITNPGGLLQTIKEKEFGKRSVSRNPIIFDFFQRLNMVEQVGSGISRMQDEMKTENLPAPHFSLKGIFVVTLYRPINFNKWIESWANKISKNQIVILNSIHQNPEITHIELSKKTKLGKTTINNNIRELKELELLQRIGSERKGYWSVSTKK